jgi:hypothetical protein
MHEDELPDDMTSEEYSEWFDKSWIPDGIGCRVGPIFARKTNMKHTPETLSNLSDDELRLWVARTMWPKGDGHEYTDLSPCIYASVELGDFNSAYVSFPDPLSPEGAFRLMVDNKIDIMFCVDELSGEHFVRPGLTVSSNPNDATLEGTARAICEAYVLMKQEG